VLEGPGWGSWPVLAEAFAAAGIASPPALGAAYAGAGYDPYESQADLEPAERTAELQSASARKHTSLSPVRISPLNMDRFKENVTPNRAMPECTEGRCGSSVAGPPGTLSPAYVPVQLGSDGQDSAPSEEMDFSGAGIEALLDVAALPPMAFYAVLELRNRRLGNSLRGLVDDMRRLTTVAV